MHAADWWPAPDEWPNIRLGVVGTRARYWHHPDRARLYTRALVHSFAPETILITGTRPERDGVDTWAAEAWNERRLHLADLTEPLIFEPDYATWGRRSPLHRNLVLVSNVDRLYAIHNGRSSGTRHVIDVARRVRKPVKVFTYWDL